MLTTKWMQLLVHTYEEIQKQIADNRWTIPTRIDSMVTHFQLPPNEFHWATRQARDIAISANSLGTWFFSKEYSCAASTERLSEIIPYRTEETGGGCLPVGCTLCPFHSIYPLDSSYPATSTASLAKLPIESYLLASLPLRVGSILSFRWATAMMKRRNLAYMSALPGWGFWGVT